MEKANLRSLILYLCGLYVFTFVALLSKDILFFIYFYIKYKKFVWDANAFSDAFNFQWKVFIPVAAVQIILFFLKKK
ncbi:hypothetical protein [Testudinibacter sp. TR-2022]|uniref:hypothetical protein n=1 Tax=Testudinibacter sp. TR-2022 TaxID=2585029 RepID=UPI001117ED75|nr:hypothetical protein [Testudinibacter sp. TR-2022]TNH23514.1 hypothetical protein FHQ29_05240 [Testudinibacter sp. TR-2022]